MQGHFHAERCLNLCQCGRHLSNFSSVLKIFYAMSIIRGFSTMGHSKDDPISVGLSTLGLMACLTIDWPQTNISDFTHMTDDHLLLSAENLILKN